MAEDSDFCRWPWPSFRWFTSAVPKDGWGGHRCELQGVQKYEPWLFRYGQDTGSGRGRSSRLYSNPQGVPWRKIRIVIVEYLIRYRSFYEVLLSFLEYYPLSIRLNRISPVLITLSPNKGIRPKTSYFIFYWFTITLSLSRHWWSGKAKPPLTPEKYTRHSS